MKKSIFAASLALLLASQIGFAQAVQKAKEVKKEMKAEKKLDKAQEYRQEAATGKGLEVAGISDKKTRLAKADRKEKKAVKKAIKSDAKALKVVAKEKTKTAAGVN
ncbi:hypothetical protein [Fibrella forsythiae]|uniref:Uncharacterized protein n=1 Tax=Fibrella forsythiae TaxID=2817061 RepID=A0ABS3JFF4_9BACT|nr:hypothetical protein [Fibrella forsythiae]MBO0948166.1 hypothetical protein [Fibrella forsythiae]